MSLEGYGDVMDKEAIAEYLERTGVGTLAMGDETGGYGIPMAFGYDRDNKRAIFQLSFGEDSLKEQFITDGARMSLSVFDWEAYDDWRSVVARGSFHRIPEEDNTVPAGIFASYSKIASPEVFREELKHLDFDWFELRIDDLTGRHMSGEE